MEVSIQQEKSGTLPMVEIWALGIPAEDVHEGENMAKSVM